MLRAEANVGVILDKGWGEVKRCRRRLCPSVVWMVAGCLLLTTGCVAVAPTAASSAARNSTLYIGSLAQGWEEVVRAHPLGPEENIKGVPLLNQPAVSHFIVQIRDRERPHIHREHDATVVMLRGRGRLVLKDRILSLRVGDAVFIARGLPHYYVNEAKEPTVALVIFTPSYDGADAVVVPFDDRPAGSP